MSALYLCVDMFCINERCLKRAAQIDSVAGQASGRLWPLTSLCYFSPLQNKLCHTSAPNITWSFPLPTPYSVSSIKSLMDVLALCHFDDSILICLCWIAERRGGGEGILQVRTGALTVWSWSDTGEGVFFFFLFSHDVDPKGWSWSGHLAGEPGLTSLTWKPPRLSLYISDA